MSAADHTADKFEHLVASTQNKIKSNNGVFQVKSLFRSKQCFHNAVVLCANDAAFGNGAIGRIYCEDKSN